MNEQKWLERARQVVADTINAKDTLAEVTLAAALAKVEAETLERAAQIAEQLKFEEEGGYILPSGSHIASFKGEYIAGAIRSAMQQEPK